MTDLTGKVAIVSGAARGQGRSHALALAQAGAKVVAFDICEQIPTTRFKMSTPEDLAETERLVASHGGEILALRGDVRSEVDTQRVVDECLNKFGRVDVVVANAGIACVADTATMPQDVWDDVIDVNLTGVFRTIRPAIAPMVSGGSGGSIVVTSSTAGLTPYPNQLPYVVAKFGLTGMVKALALELGAHGVRVNGIAPSTVKTDLALNPIFFELFTGRPDATEEEVAPMFQDLNVIQRPWLEVEEVSRVVVWLAGDETRFMTGTVIPLDLGFMVKGPFNAIDSALRLEPHA